MKLIKKFEEETGLSAYALYAHGHGPKKEYMLALDNPHKKEVDDG